MRFEATPVRELADTHCLPLTLMSGSSVGDMTPDATDQTPDQRVKQLRLVIRAEDFDGALAFYRDALGLSELAAFEGEGDARVAILDAGSATLEIANPAQVEMIDSIEADGQPSAHIRVGFEVSDSSASTAELVDAGAELIATPRETPWRSLNSRLHAPAGLEVTLFQELDAPEARRRQPGFKQP